MTKTESGGVVLPHNIIPSRRIKKIILANPPFCYFPGLYGKRLNYARPPLGISYNISYLRNYHPNPPDVSIVDAMSLGYKPQDFLNHVLREKPDILGMTVTTPNVPYVKQLAKQAKAVCPDMIFVVGGPHVSAQPQDLFPEIDICVVQEGEQTFLELVLALQNGGDLSQVKGIVYMQDGEMVRTAARPYIQDLDTIPFPARDLLPMNNYFHTYPYPSPTKRFSTMMTSRGCPYQCRFCGTDFLWGRKVRERSMENIFGEINELMEKYKVSLIFMDDDLFTLNKKRVTKFADEILRRNLKFTWICHGRADSFDEESAMLMKKSGLAEIQLGLESGDQDVLDGAKKALTLDETREGISILKKAGIAQWATFILGNTGETVESMKRTVNFAMELDCTYSSFLVLLPFPGTDIFREYKEKNYIKTYNWARYNMHFPPVFETDKLTANDIMAMKKYAGRKFYMRPKKILQFIVDAVKARSWREMYRNLATLFVIAFKGDQDIRRDDAKESVLQKNLKEAGVSTAA